jgi:ribosomal-protein-alanine N-acetyltransferase
MSPLRLIREDQVRTVWRTLKITGLFADQDALRSALALRPYRVLVSGPAAPQEIVVTRPWRVGGPVLSVQFVAADPAHRAHTVALIPPAALAAGFEQVMSPMVTDRDAAAYVSSGFALEERVLVFARDVARWGAATGARRDTPEGVTFRPAVADDADQILPVDHACFDAFWRYGPADLAELVPTHATHVAVAEDGLVVGYTMAGVQGRQGNLVRLAVAPGWRRKGVASALVETSARAMREEGARRIVLCTQADNATSQQLYARLGFAKVGPALGIYSRASEEPPATEAQS